MHPRSKARDNIVQLVELVKSPAVRLVAKCRLAWWACLSLRLMLDTDPTIDGLRTLRLHRDLTGPAKKSLSAIYPIRSLVSGRGSITVASADWQCALMSQSTLSRFLNWHIISVSVSASIASRIYTRSKMCHRYSRTITDLTCFSRYFMPSMAES